MPLKATHAVERAPQVELATLSQLKELVAMMDARNQRLTKPYMQDFLRFRLVSKPILPVTEVAAQTDEAANEVLSVAETICRREHPDIVNEVLELLAPFCDPGLDMEFRGSPKEDPRCPFECRHKILRALFWFDGDAQQVVFHRLSVALGDHGFRDLEGRMSIRGHDFNGDIRQHAFAKEREARRLLDDSFGLGAKAILDTCGVGQLIQHRFKSTGAYRYGLLNDSEVYSIQASIVTALWIAIAFLAVGDEKRANAFSSFLELQRSGTPVIYCGSLSAHVLCL